MRWATRADGRVLAEPGIKDATCPICTQPVVPKCGHIVVHHWAHKTGADCDSWSEGETAWHTSWKNCWPERKQEVRVGPHRADVISATGVLEIQHSSISPEQILERERYYARFSFYNNMAWLFDATEAWRSDRLDLVFPRGAKHLGKATFRWKHPRRSLVAALGRLYLDVYGGGEPVFRVGAIYWNENGRVGGWGQMIDYEQFLHEIDVIQIPPPKAVQHYARADDGSLFRLDKRALEWVQLYRTWDKLPVTGPTQQVSA